MLAARAWFSPNTRTLAEVLVTYIDRLPEVRRKPSGTDYCFYRGEPTHKRRFAALMLNKNSLKVRIRTDPKTFSDSKKWNGDTVCRGWFFTEGEEREFEVRNESQIDYAMELKRHLQSHPRAFVWLNIDHTNHSFT